MLASAPVLASSTVGSRGGEIQVLARPTSSKLNPYTDILYQNVRKAGVHADAYSLGRALVGRYDVLHVHWPESVFNHGLFSARVTTTALLFSMKMLKHRGAKVVWTVHNLKAHDQRFPAQEAEFWRAFVPELDGYFVLSESGQRAAEERFPELARKPCFVIPHPHYRGCYPDQISRTQARLALGLPAASQVLLFVGTIADYKNVPALIAAFRGLLGEQLRLVIAGRPRNERIWQDIRTQAEVDARILLFPGHVRDERVQEFLRAADVVVLPFSEVLNSGSAILALSFDRPVLMPSLGAAADLQRLVGDAWVKLYDGSLSANLLKSALVEAASLPQRTDGQQLQRLSPEVVGGATANAYRALLGVSIPAGG